jgi:cytochrome P450
MEKTMVRQIDLVPDHVPQELVHPYDFIGDPRNRTDLWDFVQSAFDYPDIFYSTALGGFWVVTRHDLISEVFSRSDLFSSQSATIPAMENVPDLIPPGIDPPDHGKYRKILAQSMFSPGSLAELEADARRTAVQLRSSFADAGECEFMSAFARQLPIVVFLRMMGMPTDRRDEFMHWVYSFFQGESQEEMTNARRDLHNYLNEWLDELEAGAAPTDSGHNFRAVLNAEVDGRRLTRAEQASIAETMFFAGLDTVTSLMGHVMHFLAGHPSHQAALVENPSMIPRAIEEFVRRFGVANLGRRVKSDIVFHGVKFKAQDRVMVSTQIAGLDAQKWQDPTMVDFGRNTRGHLAFGGGPHVCIGNGLARVEMRVLFQEVLPWMPGFSLKPGTTVKTFPGMVVGVQELPLVWRPLSNSDTAHG